MFLRFAWSIVVIQSMVLTNHSISKQHTKRAQGSKKMVVAPLTLSLRRAAWITPKIRDTFGIRSTVLFVLQFHTGKSRRLGSASSSMDNAQNWRGGINHFPQPSAFRSQSAQTHLPHRKPLTKPGCPQFAATRRNFQHTLPFLSSK